MLTLLVMAFSVVDAQSGEKLILKVDQYNYGNVDANDNIAWDGWETVNLRIVIDNVDRIVTINNKLKSKFYLITLIYENSGKDEDGDYYSVYQYECYDEEGIECLLLFKVWKDINLTQMTVSYSDIAVSYRCVAI